MPQRQGLWDSYPSSKMICPGQERQGRLHCNRAERPGSDVNNLKGRAPLSMLGRKEIAQVARYDHGDDVFRYYKAISLIQPDSQWIEDSAERQ